MNETRSSHPDNDNANSVLHNWARGFKGVPDGVPEALHNETMALQRLQHKKDNSAGSLGGTTAYQFDSNGRLTLIQTGRQHMELADDEQEALRQLLNSRPIPAPSGQSDHYDVFQPSDLPKTSQTLSMEQNMKVAQHLKPRQR